MSDEPVTDAGKRVLREISETISGEWGMGLSCDAAIAESGEWWVPLIVAIEQEAAAKARVEADRLRAALVFVLKATHPIDGQFFTMPRSNVERVCEVVRAALGDPS